MRISAGKGYHVANIFAENIGIMASSRKLFYEEELKPEIAWNYGINGSHDFAMLGLDFSLNAEYYYTSFVNQVIIDLDRNPGEVHIYNLKGDSYSHSFQVDLYTELFPGFEVTTAYRLNDVKMTIGGTLEDKPLMSNHKAFINMAYSTPDDEWMFDLTAEYNGSGRIPNTSSNPAEYRLDDEFPSFVIINAQITKKFGPFELYFGGENLTNYRQPYPILAYNDPFGQYFDSSMIWGPVAGVMIYSGFRWSL
jgi:outer membrane receptor protein involved in Fe transport